MPPDATSSRAEVALRRARAGEREALEAIQRRASAEAIPLPLAFIERGEVVVAELDGAIAGYAVVQGHDGFTELDGLFVEPKLWRRGIGRALADAATHEARRNGHALVVIANPGSRGFYEKCGFVAEGEAGTRFGPAVRISR